MKRVKPVGRLSGITARVSVILATSVLVLLVTGDLAHATLTREQAIRRGDSICYDANTRLNAAAKLHRPYAPFRTYHRNLAAFLGDTARIVKKHARRLTRVLRRAEADGKEHFRRWLRGLKATVPRVRGMQRAARAGRKSLLLSRTYVLERYTRKYSRHGGRYGFRRCGD